MSQLTLYTNPYSRGRIVHWMMEEIGEPYETVWMQFDASSIKSPAYLKLNPMGKVPTLQCDGTVVTEAGAICAFLADRFPEKHLIPPLGHPSRAAYYRWLFFTAGPVEMAATAKALDWQVPEDSKVMVGFGSYQDTLDALETALEPGPYICGEQFTAADVYLASALGWGMSVGTIETRPIFEAYCSRLAARPAAQAADRINAEYLKAHSA